MRFTAALAFFTCLVATSVTATPVANGDGAAAANGAPPPPVGLVSRSTEAVAIANAFEVANLQSACSPLECVSVITSAVCIYGAISSGNFAGLLACADRDKLCQCAGCIPVLGPATEEHGICPQ